ncbi:MAG: hypothetical protein WDN24_09480 [Sphingomonas sp.]
MSGFEFVFSLFGLLLGFSLVEVLGGLARTVEARMKPGAAFRIGWLTPLLGLFVLLDLISFWGAAWTARDVLHVSSATLIGSLFFAGAYYMAAHLVFPTELDGIEDLDAHFFRIKRLVLGVLLALAAASARLLGGGAAACPALCPARRGPARRRVRRAVRGGAAGARQARQCAAARGAQHPLHRRRAGLTLSVARECEDQHRGDQRH